MDKLAKLSELSETEVALMSHKLERYIFPLHPLFCLLTVWWVIELVPRRWQRRALVAITVAYCTVLVVAHEHPPPWIWENRYADMRIPSREALDRLRKNRFHPHCQMEPMLRAIEALSHRQGPHGVLWICPMWNEHPPQPPPYVNVATLASQVVRDRIVKDVVNLTPQTEIPPALVVVHPKTMEPTRVAPRLRLRERRSLTLHCEGDVVPVFLSSYRYPTGDRPRR